MLWVEIRISVFRFIGSVRALGNFHRYAMKSKVKEHFVYFYAILSMILKINVIIISSFFYRQGKDGILSVRDSRGATIVARATSVYSGDSTTMDFSSRSMIYLGGFASGVMVKKV